MIQPIRLFGDPVLRTPAEPVVDFDKELRQLVKDLTETMLDAPGVGLAAPQIGVGLRVFTYWRRRRARAPDQPEARPQRRGAGRRGGLPVDPRPGLRHQAGLRRGRQGLQHVRRAGRHRGHRAAARCVQHETDHLDGILFVDRLDTRGTQGRDEGDPRGRVVRATRCPGQGEPAHHRRPGALGVRLVFAGTPEPAPALTAVRCWPRGTRSSPSSPARTRRPGAAASSPRRRSPSSPRPPASRCSSRPTRATPSSSLRSAGSRRTRARSSRTARSSRAPRSTSRRTAGSTCTSRCCPPGAAPHRCSTRCSRRRGHRRLDVPARGGPGHRPGVRRRHRAIRPTDTSGDLLGPAGGQRAPNCWSAPSTASRTAR